MQNFTANISAHKIKCYIHIFLFSFIQSPSFTQHLNVMDFGAVADGKCINTEYIQNAIDSASANGGGRVIIPAGNFMTGTLLLKSHVNLHLEDNARLVGSTFPEDYQRIYYWKALIMAHGQENISISGKGEIDGQGRDLALHIDSLFYAGAIDSTRYNFVEMRPKEYLRPVLIQFFECTKSRISGITLKNASCWVQIYERCTDLQIDSLRVESDAYWNNDGIDIVDCRQVRITNCHIDTADDGICLKSHSADFYCEDIYVANCKVRSSASAVKFGTKSLGGFKNVCIENIEVYNTFRSAIAIESVDGGFLENVLVQNIEAKNTGNAIFIKLGHRETERKVGSLKNVTIKNIHAEIAFERPDYAYDIRGPALPFFHNTFPASISGLPGYPIEGLILENIEIKYPGKGNKGLAYAPLSRLMDIPENESDYPEFSMFGELPAWGFYVRHVNGIQMKNISISINEPDYRPAMVFDDVHNLRMEGFYISGDAKEKSLILKNSTDILIDRNIGILKL